MTISPTQSTDIARRAGILVPRTRMSSKSYRARAEYAADLWARASVAWIGVDASRSTECLEESKAFALLATEAA